MNMIEKMQLMMTERKINKADVSRGANIPYNTIVNIFNRGFKNIRYPTLGKLALFFNVPIDYLINEEIPPMLTDEESYFITLLKQLSNDEQAKVLARIKLKLEEANGEEVK
jgi:transcriptional regulator with XRE-family HTH domain